MRFVFLLLLAFPLSAQPEVCRFRAGDAVDPFRRWLTSQEVTCGPATDVPAGLWNVFVRGDGVVSAPVIVQGGVKFETPMTVPSATLLVDRPGVVYAPRRAIAYPVSGGRVIVPAGEELWLLVLEKRTIASIVPIAAIEAGKERTVDTTGALPPSLIGWLLVNDDDREALRSASGVLPPQVRLGARDADPLPALPLLDGAFVLVRGVTAGDAELSIGGRGWLPHRTRATIGSRVVTAINEPLLVRPSASIIVTFSTAEDLVGLDAMLGSCDPSKDKPPQYEIAVSACPKPKRGQPLDPASCRVIRNETFSAERQYASFAVDEIPPGDYRAELRFGKLPPISSMVTATALRQNPLLLSVTYMTLYGGLTRGGEPLAHDARIELPGGGIGFGTRETGEYRAVLKEKIIEPDDALDVIECESGKRVTVLAEEFGKPRARFDIDIPDNKITIQVTDTFTSMSLPAASVRYVVMSKLFPFTPRITRTIRADENARGRFVIEAVPPGRPIELTVSHGGYQKYVVETFTMTKSEERVIDAQLVPLRGTHAHIGSPLPFDDANVSWYTAAGRFIESAELTPDGTFVYERAHEPDEIMAVVSRSHPLWILRAPTVAQRQPLELRFPDVPVRYVAVRIEGTEDRANHLVGAVIGGLVVPSSALGQHQRMRNAYLSIRGNRSVTLRDLAETGPIEVFVSPPESPHQKLLPNVTELGFDLK